MNFKSDYGHYVNIDDIKIGAEKTTVYETVGQPSYYAANDDKVWYYIATDINRYIIASSYQFRVIKVVFDDNHKVTKVEEITSEGSFLPSFDSERTPGESIARDQTIQERITGSIKGLNPTLSSQ